MRIHWEMAAASLVALWGAAPLSAHHSLAATYDSDRQVKLAGPVTRIDWVNPHAYFFINMRDADGSVENWAVEFGNPLELEREGWSRHTLHIGDVVTVTGNPARSGSKIAFATSVVLGAGGKKLFVAPSTPRAAAAGRQPAPRWPDGQVRLGPPPGKKGYWSGASASVLMENGANVPMKDGILRNFADADRVAPMLPWAKALYLFRQRALLKDDPSSRCIPPGGPRQFQTPNGFQFVEQRELGRILVLLGGGDRNWRIIYTDGRPQGQPDEVVRGYFGTSVGHWEKDTLVVDSIGYNERFWFDNGGLPHTEGLHLTERFSRPDFGTLKYEVTVDDPRT